MGEVYCAAYERTAAGPETVIAPCVCPPRDAPSPPGAGWCGVGPGIDVCRRAAPERFAGFLAIDLQCVPEARAVAELAVARFGRGERLDPADAVPMYVRDKVALTCDERRVRGIRA
jgi:tRNA threonylcarbamoyladenosine biosynthesis protein TsaB